ncbi:ABC transporter permease [Symbiobacterium thermophilum]|uniref:ABC transporter permease n=2 Tax=Symbiobacterium thermophilum TaxID=2734 RepID=A0A953LIR9_SYMTR|nr:ABC transporter permease [Symbiobacterium thermophilum]MBY6276364.1 ABC transporter permease [Symbiobacterium thermophilum]
MEILRNLYRRRLRTGLTVLGIAVGILAFTVMGAMAEKFNRLIAGGEAYFANRIAVHSTGGALRLNLLGPEDIEVMKRTPGVRHVETHIMMALDETAGFELAPRFLVGINLPNFARAQLIGDESARLRLARGNWWRPGERQVAVLGSAVAHKMKLDVGDTLQARGRDFRVVGVLEETLSLPDGWALIPEEDARELLLEGSSLLQALGLELERVWTNAYALVEPGMGDELTDRLAHSLRRGYLLHSPEQLVKAAGTASSVLNAAILGSGAIAVIVGSLAVVNTMFFAVGERTREIGIKKAIGAGRWAILREFLAESVLIGFLGGLLGLGVAAGLIAVLNGYAAQEGTPVFLLTPRLALGALGFATVLGGAAGAWPAWRAANLDPVEALRAI